MFYVRVLARQLFDLFEKPCHFTSSRLVFSDLGFKNESFSTKHISAEKRVLGHIFDQSLPLFLPFFGDSNDDKQTAPEQGLKKSASGHFFILTRLVALRIYLGMGRKAYTARDLIRPTATQLLKDQPAPISCSPAATTPEWLTKEEMIGRLKMGKRFFEGLVKRRKIPLRRYSRKMVRFNPVAVEAALKVYDVGAIK